MTVAPARFLQTPPTATVYVWYPMYGVRCVFPVTVLWNLDGGGPVVAFSHAPATSIGSSSRRLSNGARRHLAVVLMPSSSTAKLIPRASFQIVQAISSSQQLSSWACVPRPSCPEPPM